ncbi:flavodoxin family protein [Pelomyxa schiedti]|nr:flavodoxin family protein [Pelomyxa schiedti]
MVKVVAVLGSPRPQSNSTKLARKALEVCKANGAETEEFILSHMPMKGCLHCGGCKTNGGRCVITDEFQRVINAVVAADAVIFTTPVYWGDCSSWFKLFWDRNYCFMRPDFTSTLPPGKKLMFIVTQGAPDPNMFKAMVDRFSHSFKWIGFDVVSTHLFGGLNTPNTVTPEQMAEVAAAAPKLL